MLPRTRIPFGRIAEQGEQFGQAERLLRVVTEVTVVTRQNCPRACLSFPRSRREE